MSRIVLYTLFTVLAFTGTFLYDHYYRSQVGFEQFASLIERDVHTREAEVASLWESVTAANVETWRSALSLSTLANRKYTLLQYDNDKLVFWSNNDAMTTPDSSERICHLNNGVYYVKKKDLGASKCLLALFPIKYEYNIDFEFRTRQPYVENHFVASDIIPTSLKIKNASYEGIPIKNLEYEDCCTFEKAACMTLSNAVQYRLCIAFLISFLLLSILISSLTRKFIENERPGIAILFFILSVVGIKWLTVVLDFNTKLQALPLFEASLPNTSFFDRSPGAMLINILLMLWIIIFYYKNIDHIQAAHLSKPKRIGLAAILYVVIIIGILMLIDTHRAVMLSPRIKFDFDNFYYFEVASALTVMSVLMMWFALFLFNFKISGNIIALQLNKIERIAITIMLLSGLGILLYFRNPFNISIMGILMVCGIYLPLMDRFYETKERTSFSWFLSWLFMFGITSTILFYNYKREGDLMSLRNIMTELETGRDSTAAHSIKSIAKAAMSTTDTLRTKDDLDKFISKSVKNNAYLIDNYSYKLSDTTTATKAGSFLVLPDSNGRWNNSTTITIADEQTYRVEFFRKTGDELGYNEQLFRTPYLHINDLADIHYQIFYKNKLIESQGSYPKRDIYIDSIPPQGTQYEDLRSDFSKITVHAADGRVIVGAMFYGGLTKMIYLLAYLLIALMGFSFLILALNAATNFIDDFFIVPKGTTFQRKVQYYVVGMVFFTSLMVGLATLQFEQINSDDRYQARISEKFNAVKKSIEKDLSPLPNINNKVLNDAAIPISQIHQIDINLYDLEGKIINPEGKNTLDKGIISTVINPFAYAAFGVGRQNYTVGEHIGKFDYQTAYGTIIKNDTVQAYFGLPHYRMEWDRLNAESEVIGTLLVVYVLLFIPMIIFSFLIAQKLTQPIKEIGEKLSLVRLGQTTLDVEWKGNDALGDLIRDFNKMLSKLDEESVAERLQAQENAWRQMARQVSHDLRNGVTPLKLSIEYLNYYADKVTDLDYDFRQNLNRIVNTSKERIEDLISISDKFKLFANTKKEETVFTDININDFLALNTSFSSDEINRKIAINTHLPEEYYIVNADRTQMSRVITNLITNATQAIPENREGRIDVYLIEKDEKTITIRISDNGTGIEPHRLPLIFQPNFTTRSSGTGLGLAICRRLIEEAGGKIYCESTINQGSDFYIELQIVDKIIPNSDENDTTNDN